MLMYNATAMVNRRDAGYFRNCLLPIERDVIHRLSLGVL